MVAAVINLSAKSDIVVALAFIVVAIQSIDLGQVAVSTDRRVNTDVTTKECIGKGVAMAPLVVAVLSKAVKAVALIVAVLVAVKTVGECVGKGISAVAFLSVALSVA